MVEPLTSKTLLMKHGDMEVEDMEGFVEIHDAGESVMLKNEEAAALRDWLCQRFPRQCDHGVSLSLPCERCRHPDEPAACNECDELKEELARVSREYTSYWEWAQEKIDRASAPPSGLHEAFVSWWCDHGENSRFFNEAVRADPALARLTTERLSETKPAMPTPDCPHCDGFDIGDGVVHAPKCPTLAHETDEPLCRHGAKKGWCYTRLCEHS